MNHFQELCQNDRPPVTLFFPNKKSQTCQKVSYQLCEICSLKISEKNISKKIILDNY